MYCILVTGAPATGKSTLSDYLARQLELPVIAKDSIKEVLFDCVGFRSRAEKVKLGTASMHIMYYMAAQLMQRGLPFLLDNNFEDASREGLFRLLEEYHYTAVTLRLTGDYRVLYRRFAQRDRDPGRHRGHVVNDCYPEPPGAPAENPSLLSLEGYLRAIEDRGLDRFCGNGPCITVDTTDLSRVDPEEVLAQVRRCIREL